MTTTIPPLDKLSYSLPEFAKAVSVGTDSLRKHIKAGNLVASYVGTKPIITRENGEAWLRALPTEKPAD